MSKKGRSYLTTILGVIVLAAGMALLKLVDAPEGVMPALPYVCIGIGCGLFGRGMGNLISERTYKNYPEAKVQYEIDLNDERNILIANKAKAKAYDLMIFVFGALMLAFALMEVDMIVILLIVCSYLIIIGFGIFYRCKYDKEM